MREPGIPKLLTWRWAPCAALVLGALSFCGFTLLAIPDHIGESHGSSSASLRLGNQLSRTQTTPPSADWSSGSESEASEPIAASPAAHVASRPPSEFPKRGFSPPLDRPAGPPAVAMPALQAPAPALAPPPPPPAPEPAAPPPPAPEPQAEAPAPPPQPPTPN